MKLPSIMSPDGRRAWAFIAIVGGCMVFTGFAAASLYLVQSHPTLAFWLGLAAHVQILVGMTALGWTLGRRMMLSGGRDGVTISDSGTTVTATAKLTTAPAEPEEPIE